MSKARAGAAADSDDDFIPPSQGAARGVKKHPVTEAVLRFAIEKKGPKAGPYVNKIFEQAIEGAEQEAAQVDDDADGGFRLIACADCRHGQPRQGRIWKSVVKLFASIRFALLAKMVRKIAE